MRNSQVEEINFPPKKRCGHIGKQWNLNNVYSITMNNQNSSYDDDNDAYIKKNNLKKEFL